MAKERHIFTLSAPSAGSAGFVFILREHDVLVEGEFPGESFSEEEYGDIGTRKPYVVTAIIFLFFFSYCGLKNSETLRKTGGLLSLYTNGIKTVC